MSDFEPIVIGESDEARRRREEQIRRDDEARAAALRALQQVEPQLQAVEQAAPRVPEDVGAEPVEPYRGRITTPYAQIPGARVTDGGGVALRGEPQTPAMIREHQQARAAGPVPTSAPAAAPPMAQPPAASPRPAPRLDVRPPPVDPVVMEDARRAPEREQARAAARAELEQRATRTKKPPMPEPGRMDDGLPTQDDIDSASRGDAFRTAMAVIASALAGYTGSGQQFRARREAEGLRQQRTAGIERARNFKGAELERMEEARRFDVTQAARSEQQAGQLDIARMRESRAAEQAEAQRMLLEARTTRERTEAERRLAATQVDSAESQRARSRYVLEALPRMAQLERGRPREELRAEIEQQIAGLSAYDIERMEGELPSLTIGARTSGAGGGGAGGVRAPGREGVTRQQAAVERIRAAVDRGMDPATAEQLERDGDLARIVAQDALTRGPQQQAEEYGERLAMSGLAQADEALRAVEEIVGRFGEDIPGQGPLDTLGGLRPGATMSEDAREYQRRVRRLLDSQLRQATGANAPESEVRTFRDILGLSDTSTDADVRAALRDARAYINSEYNALRGAYRPEAIQEWERRARTSRGRGDQASVQAPAEAPQPQGGGRTVRIYREGSAQPVTLPADDPRVRSFRGRPGYRVEEVR